MIPQAVIEKKRDGGSLSELEFVAFLEGYERNAVSDEQMAALLMAVFFRGMSNNELATLVDQMLHSGRVLDLSHLDGPRIDKHSTGGVGDKVSLVLAPLAAAMGIYVPMMSGRGLGHTGGTLDKLEAIPGFRTALSLDRFQEILADVGCAMIGQTDEIAPLDKRLYALRDVTGTVSSIPLITASIMSKKLAEGLTGLVLDVKVGSGAFLPDLADARELADAMIRVGALRGLPVTAVLTAMDRPLGRTVGNGLEVSEALECLRGGGPDELRNVVLELATEMALMAGVSGGTSDAHGLALRALDGGGALERMARLVAAQGGDAKVVEGRSSLPAAPAVSRVTAPVDGVVTVIDPKALGYGLISLGGGRTHQDQSVDGRVGFELAVGVGDVVNSGDLIATVHAKSDGEAQEGIRTVLEAIEIEDGGEASSPHGARTSAHLPLIIEHRRGEPPAP